MSCRRWTDLCTTDFRALDVARTIVILPVAAVEQHGPHLPLGVDVDLAEAVIEASVAHVAPDVPVLLLPTQPVGYSVEHERFAGTLGLSAETVLRLWTELGAAVARTGLRKLLLFTAHGGQVSLMDVAARALRAQHDLIVYSASWFSLPLAEMAPGALFDAQELRYGVHAGAVETSMMLACQPGKVDMGKAAHFESTTQARVAAYPTLQQGAKFGWQTQDLNPQGAAGDATLATAAKGRVLIDAAGKALARLLAEYSALPLSTLVARPDLGRLGI